MSSQESQFLAWLASSRTIAFRCIYTDMAKGDLVAGLMLSQIVYWSVSSEHGGSRLRVEKDGMLWLAKSHHDWWQECRIGRKQMARAISVLKKEGLIEVRICRFNGTPTSHIRLLMSNFLVKWVKCMDQTTSQNTLEETKFRSLEKSRVFAGREMSEFPIRGESEFPNGTMDCPKRDNPLSQTGQSLTETTTETEEEYCPNIAHATHGHSHATNGRTKPRGASAKARARQRPPHPGGASPETEEQELFPSLARRARPSKSDQECAARLHDAVRRAGELSRRSDVKEWAQHFRLLREQDEIAPNEIARVLGWYVSVLGQPMIPEAFCGATFRSKFLQIRRAQRRAESDQRRSDSDGGLTAHESAEAEFRSAYYKRWPGCNGTMDPPKEEALCKELGLPSRYRITGPGRYQRRGRLIDGHFIPDEP